MISQCILWISDHIFLAVCDRYVLIYSWCILIIDFYIYSNKFWHDMFSSFCDDISFFLFVWFVSHQCEFVFFLGGWMYNKSLISVTLNYVGLM